MTDTVMMLVCVCTIEQPVLGKVQNYLGLKKKMPAVKAKYCGFHTCLFKYIFNDIRSLCYLERPLVMWCDQ